MKFKVDEPFWVITSASHEAEFFTEVSCTVAPPETEEQKTVRVAKEKRIAELLAELESLGWEEGDWRDD